MEIENIRHLSTKLIEMMRAFFFFTCFLFSWSHAQTGGMVLECLDKVQINPLAGIVVEVHTDSLCMEAMTDSSGRVFLRNVPIGKQEVWFYSAAGNELRTTELFVQENQLLQNTFFFDAHFTLDAGRKGDQFEEGSGGSEERHPNQYAETVNRLALASVNNVQEIKCIAVRAYSVPLIDRYGSTVAVVSLEDLEVMQARSAVEWAGSVGGVNVVESSGNMHIRGSRSDASTYYLDGIRIRNDQGIPKAYISEVRVISGGIPANYGDVTGGVVDIRSKPVRTHRTYIPKSSKKKKKVPVPVEEVAEHVEPEEPPVVISYDRFLPIYENDFLSTVGHPNSTFGLDVDQASWTYVRQRLTNRQQVQRDAVKLEEMINSFHYDPVEVPEGEDFGVDIRRHSCPWNTTHQLVSVHLKAKELPKDTARKRHNLVLLIDVSGSMSASNKLPLLVEGMKDFVKSLDEQDLVSIVTYAGYSGVVLPPTSCDRKEDIIQALDNLSSGGSTNGTGGITEAYRLAEDNFDPEKNNRIILATDGDFNVGIHSEGDLESYIEQKRGKGIYLTALGFGMGNYKNSILETLADRGDGNHFYINNRLECKKVLIDGIGNILNLARDVKLNVEFNPEYVREYRLIGYENRLLRPRDFEDDTKDAGEIGYGHEVTAVYEIVPGEAEKEKNHFVTAKPQHNRSELAYIKLRYKPLEATASVERRFSVGKDVPLTDDRKLQSIVALGLYLRNSVFKGTMDVGHLQRMGQALSASDPEEADLQAIMLSISH